jgi:uncharacterized protein (DUF2249 family)
MCRKFEWPADSQGDDSLRIDKFLRNENKEECCDDCKCKEANEKAQAILEARIEKQDSDVN